jgi:N-acetylglucosamine kinase-like BadF-type ATPase
MTAEAFLLGIDGGQTSTKALLAQVDGTVRARGQGGPSDNFYTADGEAKNRCAIHGAIRAALEAAGVSAERVVAVGMGHTGAFAAAKANPVPAQIIREVVPAAEIVVASDVVTNLAGASGGQPGVVVIAGGGSVAYGVTADGREALAGGWGNLLGDEGSAFDIGRRAISAATRASDGQGEPTALEALVMAELGLAAMRDVMRVVYAAGFPRDRIARLAPKVADAARAGDSVARRIMTSSGEQLAELALAAIRQIHEPGEAVPVYLTGGVFQAGDLVRAPFRAALHLGWPDAEPREPRFPPVAGALILARRAAGDAADTGWLERVAASLDG